MMKYVLPENAPQLLKDADTFQPVVEVTESGYVIWKSGNFRGGNFRGGDFRGGNFLGGDFRGGYFRGGDFRGGDFRGGNFRGGNFLGGDFRGGNFLGGNFLGGNVAGMAAAKLQSVASLYPYSAWAVLYANGERWVKMGCLFKSLEAWESEGGIRNSNLSEFPDDGSERSEERAHLFEFAKGVALRLKPLQK
jgi:uncharacterized protein YjbI with pentapeptide repeats